MEKHLDKLQKEIDELYEKEGLTDEVLDKQIYINKLRNAHNISDKSNSMNGEYVQWVNHEMKKD